MEKISLKFSVIFVILLLLTFNFFSTSISSKTEFLDEKENIFFINSRSNITVRVALYKVSTWRYGGTSTGVNIVKKKLSNYHWNDLNSNYLLHFDILTFNDVASGKLNTDNYDVFIILGTYFLNRSYLLNKFLVKKWNQNVITFIKNGGGYVGTCGGAVLPCLNPIVGWPLCQGLELVNIRSHLKLRNEAQYSLQIGGGVPVKIKINASMNPIFYGLYDKERSINYWGGPGLSFFKSNNPKCGPINILAAYAEEPSDVAPIHRQLLFGGGKVKTKVKGTIAALATVYNDSGRIVLFSPHPEYWTWLNVIGNPKDNIREGFIFSKKLSGKFYDFLGGKLTSYYGGEYNMWMITRAVAWVAKLPDSAVISIPANN